jgi:hypothetical protein
MWRESLSKQSQMMDTVARMREQMKLKQSEMSDQLVAMEAKLLDQEHRVSTLQKQIDFGALTDSARTVAPSTTDNSLYQRETDTKFLKDLILDEKNKREFALQEHFKLFAQLQTQIGSIEGEVAKKLKEHRQD